MPGVWEPDGVQDMKIARQPESRSAVLQLIFLFVCLFLGAKLTDSYGESVASVLSIEWELGRTVIWVLLSCAVGIILASLRLGYLAVRRRSGDST